MMTGNDVVLDDDDDDEGNHDSLSFPFPSSKIETAGLYLPLRPW